MVTAFVSFVIISLVGGYFIGSWLDKKEKEYVSRKEPTLKS